MVMIRAETAQIILDAILDYAHSPYKTRKGEIRRAFNCEVDYRRYHLVMHTEYHNLADEYRVLIRLRFDQWHMVDGVRYHENQANMFSSPIRLEEAVNFLRKCIDPNGNAADEKEGYGEW